MTELFTPVSDQLALFRDDVSTAEVVAHPSWCALRDDALRAASHPGLTVVLGEVGMGKSLLLRDLQRRLVKAGRNACLLQHGNFGDQQTSDIILIDEAERLPVRLLAALAECGRPCVIAGLPRLAAHLTELRPRPLVLRLGPLPAADIAGFLLDQLKRSGHPAGLLGDDAIAALGRASSGVPRQLQLLAGLAVFLARMSDAPCVTAEHVAEAALIREETALQDADPLPAGDEPVPTPALAVPAAHPAPRKRGGRVWALTLGGAVAAGVCMAPSYPGPDILTWSRPATDPATPGPVSVVPGTGSPELPAELPRDTALDVPPTPGPGPGGILGAEAGQPRPPTSEPDEVAAAPDAKPIDPPLGLPGLPVQPEALPVPPVPTVTASTAMVPVPADEPASAASMAETGVPGPLPVPPLPVPLPVPAPAALPSLSPASDIAAMTDLPPLPVLRVQVNYIRGDAGAALHADEVVGIARRLGIAVAAPNPVTARSREPGVIYFFVEDGDRAAELVREFGGLLGAASLAARTAMPAPRPGTIEITLAPTGSPPIPLAGPAGIQLTERSHP